MKGVVAEAEVASAPEAGKVDGIDYPVDRFPWRFKVHNARFFYDTPVAIDADMRARLEAFQGRDLSRAWSWFVQATRIISRHDFSLLTGRSEPRA